MPHMKSDVRQSVIDRLARTTPREKSQPATDKGLAAIGIKVKRVPKKEPQ